MPAVSKTLVPLGPGQPGPRFRSAYGPRFRVTSDPVGASLTRQSFAAECDINVIMRRYEKTGALPPMNEKEARYIDTSSLDYQDAMFKVADARSAFLELPWRLRDRFGNDPAQLLRFLEDPKNLEEARTLGLVNPEGKPAIPLAVRVVEPAVSDPGAPSTVPGVIAKPVAPKAP